MFVARISVYPNYIFQAPGMRTIFQVYPTTAKHWDYLGTIKYPLSPHYSKGAYFINNQPIYTILPSVAAPRSEIGI